MAAPSSGGPPSKPLAIAHLQNASKCFRFYQQVKAAGEHLDWAVIILFYTAMHLVQAYLVQEATSKAEIPLDHGRRGGCVYLKLPELGADFDFLLTRSKWARYELDRPTPTPALVQQYEDGQFAKIRTRLHALGYQLSP
jgi:hypothetical protein